MSPQTLDRRTTASLTRSVDSGFLARCPHELNNDLPGPCTVLCVGIHAANTQWLAEISNSHYRTVLRKGRITVTLAVIAIALALVAIVWGTL
jgi:hypothetical protein